MPRIAQRAAARRTTPASPREQSKGGEGGEGGGGRKKGGEGGEEGGSPFGFVASTSSSFLSLSLSLISFACAESGVISTERQSGGTAGEFLSKRERKRGRRKRKKGGVEKKEVHSLDHHEHLRNLSSRPREKGETNGSGCQKSSRLPMSGRVGGGRRGREEGGKGKKRR